MKAINEVINYILNFESFVLLPLILFFVSIIARMKVKEAIKSALMIGIGFIGINIVFTYFMGSMGPAMESLVGNLSLDYNTIDAGWSPFAMITWSSEFIGPLMLSIVVVNFIMLITGMTKTVNIDIFNYWHFMFGGLVIYTMTGSFILMLASIIVTNILVLKFADWMGPQFEKYSKVEGVTTTTLSCVTYYPISEVLDRFFDRIPKFNQWTADAESIKKRFGAFGEPIFIGFVMGCVLGFGGGYDIKGILELGVQFAAIILLLPKMCEILAGGLGPISSQMTHYVEKRFPRIGKTYIAVDAALIIGKSSVIVTGLLLIPVIILLALVLPGVTYIPLGDLAFIMIITAAANVVNKGNIIRSFVIGVPIAIAHLYLGSFLAPQYTRLAEAYDFSIEGYSGFITSTTDGGNVFRVFIIELFQGHPLAFAALPIFGAIVIYARHISMKKTI